MGNALPNYKTLVCGQSLSVNVKYEPNRVIECHGVFLQLMNDDPTFYEGGPAMFELPARIIVRLLMKRKKKSLSDWTATQDYWIRKLTENSLMKLYHTF